MTSSTNRTEQSPEQQEVVVWLLGRLGKFHRAVNNLMEVGLYTEEKMQKVCNIFKTRFSVLYSYFSRNKRYRTFNQDPEFKVKFSGTVTCSKKFLKQLH